MGKNEIEFKSVLKVDKVVNYLEELTASLKKGVLCVQKDSDYVVLNLGELLKVEIEAKEKKDKCKFSLELSWKNGLEEKGESSELIISSLAPQVESDPGEGEDNPDNSEEPAGQDESPEDQNM